MMKLNRKGFMMAEVVVVSAVVLTTLTTLYISYNKVLSLYKTRLTYNDVTTLYRLAYYRDSLTNSLNTETIQLSDSDLLCNNTCEENVFVVYNNKKSINTNVLDKYTVNKTYKEYVDYLSDSVDLSKSDYVMLMEYCNNDNENCKYAYLELDKD